MERMAVNAGRVFVVQITNPRVNLAPARDFGELQVLLDPDAQVTLTAAPTVRDLATKLRDFNDDDHIVPMGDPVAIGIVCSLAARLNGGKYKMLKWDKKINNGLGGYWAVQVELP